MKQVIRDDGYFTERLGQADREAEVQGDFDAGRVCAPPKRHQIYGRGVVEADVKPSGRYRVVHNYPDVVRLFMKPSAWSPTSPSHCSCRILLIQARPVSPDPLRGNAHRLPRKIEACAILSPGSINVGLANFRHRRQVDHRRPPEEADTPRAGPSLSRS